MTDRFTKDPQAVLDYQFDWADWLATGEGLTSHTVTVPDGLTNAADSRSDTAVIVWLAAGAVDSDYRVVCHIETSQGREDDRTMLIQVRQR